MPANAVPVRIPTPPSTADVRGILNQWSRRGWLRVRGLGDRVRIEEVQPHSSFTVSLHSEYETRSVSRSSRPFHGGAVDNQGLRPRPEDLPVRRPVAFEDRTETLPVPHTESVQPCTGCNGMGVTRCQSCQGRGKVPCPWCQGKGYRERNEARVQPDPSGQLTTQMVTVRDNCTCSGGKVDCGPCHGRGQVPCGPCAGSGRVVTFDLLTVRFQAVLVEEVLSRTPVPDHKLKKAAGVVLVDVQEQRIEAVPSLREDVDTLIGRLLEASSRDRPEGARLLFQWLRVGQVSVYEVSYTFRGSGRRRLWIYGEAHAVHAPGAPRAWLRLAAYLLGASALIAGLAYFFWIHAAP